MTSNPIDLYLDQNHLIGLARVFHGKESEPNARQAGNFILQEVKDGRMRVPVSRVHLLESTKITDQSRRRRLNDALIVISRRWVVKPVEALTGEELINWKNTGSGKVGTAIGRGLLAAFGTYQAGAGNLGVEPEALADEDLLGDTDAAWRFALGRLSANPLVHANAAAYAGRVESVRQDWNALPERERTLRYAEGLLNDTVTSLEPLTDELKGALNELEKSPVEELPARMRQIPTLDVLLTLGTARARDTSKPTDRNDLWDFGFLSAAIPYFDVVVTEKTWAHFAAATGIANRYGCRVLAKLKDVPGVLASKARE